MWLRALSHRRRSGDQRAVVSNGDARAAYVHGDACAANRDPSAADGHSYARAVSDGDADANAAASHKYPNPDSSAQRRQLRRLPHR